MQYKLFSKNKLLDDSVSLLLANNISESISLGDALILFHQKHLFTRKEYLNALSKHIDTYT